MDEWISPKEDRRSEVALGSGVVQAGAGAIRLAALLGAARVGAGALGGAVAHGQLRGRHTHAEAAPRETWTGGGKDHAGGSGHQQGRLHGRSCGRRQRSQDARLLTHEKKKRQRTIRTVQSRSKVGTTAL